MGDERGEIMETKFISLSEAVKKFQKSYDYFTFRIDLGTFESKIVGSEIFVEENGICKELGISKEMQESVESQPVSASLSTKKVAPPIVAWTGETLTTQKAAKQKGYKTDKIRRMCKEGKLDYVLSHGRFYVCLNEKWENLQDTVEKTLEKRVAELEKENALLREENAILVKKVESAQMEFSFSAPPEIVSKGRKGLWMKMV